MSTIEHDECCACKACVFICPMNCIKIKDKNLEYRKVVDEKKCINCGKCIAVCPHKSEQRYYYNTVKKSYCARAKKRRLNDRSASGGIAAAIYYYCIQRNIVCIGVRWKNRKLVYDYVTAEAIKDFLGSKYMYADLSPIYDTIGLYKNRQILFIGLPCQIVAMRKYLNETKIDIDVIYIDLVCDGACASEMFIKHVKKMKIENYNSVSFREYDNNYGLTVCENGTPIYYTYHEDAFCYVLNRHISYMENCYQCIFACEERVGDITIKDFCGSPSHSFFRGNQLWGLSSVLINTEEGQDFWDKIRCLLEYEKDDYKKTVESDPRLKGNIYPKHRQVFKRMCGLLGFELTCLIWCRLKI